MPWLTERVQQPPCVVSWHSPLEPRLFIFTAAYTSLCFSVSCILCLSVFLSSCNSLPLCVSVRMSSACAFPVRLVGGTTSGMSVAWVGQLWFCWLQAAAIANGLHQLLLNWVADTHALLALKAFQPSQQAPTASTARVARTDHRHARTAARVARAAAKRPGVQSAEKAAFAAIDSSTDLQIQGDKLISLASCCVAGIQRNTAQDWLCSCCSHDVLLRWLINLICSGAWRRCCSLWLCTNLCCAYPSMTQTHVSDMLCSEMIHCAGPDSVAVVEEKEATNAESECSVGLHSGSYVEPCSQAACTRQQLLMAISLLKHLAHNSPAAGEALVGAGVMDTIRR